MPRKIVLIGPMGAGKTSLGKRLASKLRWAFADTDHMIVARTGADISLIFEREGEMGFRCREHEVLRDVLAEPRDMVVSCGGGIVLLAQNRQLLMAQALVIFLDISVERQLQRVKNDRNRPLLKYADRRQKLQQLREERWGLYEGIADIYLSTDENHFTTSFQRLIVSIKEFARQQSHR
ncbi:shikimate kinase [Dichelobacter nodosus]|uniref:Shikimate kinase n=1 Tax=Dichelobacter nodosus (strain VCS1703A) TaxID=246195 RepID=A5EVD6_DICNV|nr:shikimate kinase [Dichelobacter nodosus]ABQ13709.1 shikimate kinase I [Dichelobacter nodosus VCS1703A]